MKHALITGITGQDGSYLAELLLEKGYEVYGIWRRKATVDYGNIAHLKERLHLIYADMTDSASLIHAMQISQADEVYNLAAQSFVATSWDTPLSTSEINALGVVNMLEAIRMVKPDCRFYQASTSEMFGKAQEVPQTETTPFYPRSPYGIAKLYGHSPGRSPMRRLPSPSGRRTVSSWGISMPGVTGDIRSTMCVPCG